MSRKSFVKGAAILGAAGVIVKILGAFFRIPLANIIGDTGMGYYQTAYPIYVLLLNISIAGIPTAIARMVSEQTAGNNHREAYRIFKLSFALMAAIGLTTCLVLVFGAPFFVKFSSPKAIYAIWAISPALLIIPMMSSFRGYFQGLQDMTPTAVSQVTEQFFRVITGLTLAIVLVPYGLQFAAAGASFGAAAGGTCGLIVILVIFMRKRSGIKERIEKTPADAPSEKSSAILKKLIIIAIPITIGASIMPLMNNVDLVIVPRRLIQIGYSAKEANSLYGQLSGFAAPLINLPQVLTQSIALSLVPAIASARQTGDLASVKNETETSMRMAMIVGLPCAAGLFALAGPLMQLLYPAQRASAANAADCLAILAVGAIFLSSVQTLTGVLQGVGRQMIPVVNLVIGIAVKAVITYALAGIPELNVRGAALGTLCAYFTASILNFIAAQKYTGAKFSLSMTFVRPGMAALIMGVSVRLIYSVLYIFAGNVIAVVAAVLAGVIIYTFLVLAFRAISREEMLRFPKGKTIVAVMDRFGRH